MISKILLWALLIVLICWFLGAITSDHDRNCKRKSEAYRLLRVAEEDWETSIGKAYKEICQRNMIYKCSLKVSMLAKEKPNEYIYKYFYKDKDDRTKESFRFFIEDSYENRLRLYNKAIEERDKIESLLKQQTLSNGESLEEYIPSPVWEILPPEKPQFLFWYISPKGRAQNLVKIPATSEVLEYVKQKEEWRNSASGQRSLMTPKLREEILKRDNYTCKICGNSTMVEPNLLLEVDHIIPVSKGGKTVPDNLQTLCWKCNRSKSDKIIKLD